MIDRKRVLEELALALEWCSEDDNPRGSIAVKIFAIRGALELLKEQEPVKPIRLENWLKCPACGQNIVANMKYCPGCGNKVDWSQEVKQE